MKQQQVTYALDRLRTLCWKAEATIEKKYTKKVRRLVVQTRYNRTGGKRAKESLAKAYDRARDEVVLGDEAVALKLIQAFAKRVG